MKRIPIENAVPGMILAEDLPGPGGMILLPRGLVLTNGHIESLKTRGATALAVTDPSEERSEPAPLDPALLEQARLGVAPLFLFADTTVPAMAALFQLAAQRAARLLAAGKGLPERPAVNPKAETLTDLFFKAEGTAESLVRHETSLVSFPDIYFKIRSALNSHLSSAREIADLISKDTSLTAKLLRLVNSPFYGFPQKISSISRAVMVVGGDEISMLALGVSAINAFKDVPAELAQMRDFWLHSIACGAFAKVIGDRLGSQSAERLFVAGMLHDLGRLVMLRRLPHAMAEAIFYSLSNQVPLVEAERDVIGFTHAKVGALLTREWKFPEELTRVVKHHHAPLASLDKTEPAVIHVADALAVGLGYTLKGSIHLGTVEREVWETVGLGPGDLAEVIDEGERQIAAIMRAFFGPE